MRALAIEAVAGVGGNSSGAGTEPGRMIVEEYLPGSEVAVDGLLTDGELTVLAILDKPYSLEGPYFEETIYVTPSRFSEAEQESIKKSFVNAARALGLANGPVHGEFRLNERGVWPIEVAARPIGGLCARALRFQVENEPAPIGLEELLLRHALNLPGKDALRETAAVWRPDDSPVPIAGIPRRRSGSRGRATRIRCNGVRITARWRGLHRRGRKDQAQRISVCEGRNPAEVESALRSAVARLNSGYAATPVEHPVTGKVYFQPWLWGNVAPREALRLLRRKIVPSALP